MAIRNHRIVDKAPLDGIPMDTWNRFAEAADRVIDGGTRATPPAGSIAKGGRFVNVKNGSAAAVDRWEVMGIERAQIDEGDGTFEYEDRPTFLCLADNLSERHYGNWVIARQPLAADQIGSAVASGVTTAWVDNRDNRHRRCDIVYQSGTRYLQSSFYGAAEILERGLPRPLGLQLMQIRIEGWESMPVKAVITGNHAPYSVDPISCQLYWGGSLTTEVVDAYRSDVVTRQLFDGELVYVVFDRAFGGVNPWRIVQAEDLTGHGSMSMSTPQSGTVNAGWSPITQFDTIDLTPVNCTLNTSTGEFNLKLALWYYTFQISWSHNEQNQGRTYNLRAYNVSQATPLDSVEFGVGRNNSVSNATLSGLIVGTAIQPGDFIRFEIGGGSSFSSVQFNNLWLDLHRVG